MIYKVLWIGFTLLPLDGLGKAPTTVSFNRIHLQHPSSVNQRNLARPLEVKVIRSLVQNNVIHDILAGIYRIGRITIPYLHFRIGNNSERFIMNPTVQADFLPTGARADRDV